MNFRTWRAYAFPLILVAYLLLAVIYSTVVPLFEAPDELQHYFYIHALTKERALPVLDPEVARPWHEEGFPPRPYADVWAQEGGQPPLYYLLGALLTSPIDTGAAVAQIRLNPHANIGDPLLPGNKNHMIHTADETWPWHGLTLAVHVARLFSILLGLGTLVLGRRLLQILFPQQPDIVLAALALTAFNPQFIFISSAVSNDNLIIFLATLILYQLMRILQTPPAAFTGGQALKLGILLGLALLSKLSGISLLGVVLLMLGLWGLAHQRLLLVLRRIALILLAALGVGGWWYVRNIQLYGDPTALKPFLQIVGGRPQALSWDNLSTELQGLRISFLAIFGWFNLLLPAIVYRLWNAFLVMSGVGLALAAGRRWYRGWRPSLRSPRDISFLALTLWIIVLFISLLHWISMTPGAQARLLFPAIIAINLFLLRGWRELWPKRRSWLLLPLAGLFILALLSPFTVIRPAYHPPPTIAAEAIPAEARLSDPVDIDGRVRLLGASVRPTRLYPHESFALTLYWQALAPIPYDASIFVHLLGAGNQTVGGIDTYPGWGTAPTSQWTPGLVLVDAYRIRIPASVAAPTLLKVDVGLFDYTSKQSYPSLTASGQAPPLGIATLQIPLPAQANDTLPADVLPVVYVFADQIQLTGYRLADTTLHPGDDLAVTLVWKGLAPMSEDYVVFVHLLNEAGQRAAGFDSEPRGGWWPTSAWEPGAQVVDPIHFALPLELTPGRYNLRVGLYLRRTLQRLPVSGPDVRDNAVALGTVLVQ